MTRPARSREYDTAEQEELKNLEREQDVAEQEVLESLEREQSLENEQNFKQEQSFEREQNSEHDNNLPKHEQDFPKHKQNFPEQVPPGCEHTQHEKMNNSQQSGRKPRVLIFYDKEFPASADMDADAGMLGRIGDIADMGALERIGDVVDADGLAEALRSGIYDVLAALHMPYYPKAAWLPLMEHLRGGKGLIAAGGAPFKRPAVRTENGCWRAEPPQVAYHRTLHIHEALPVDGSPVIGHRAGEEVPLFQGYEDLFAPADTWNLVPHVTRASDHPGENGSAGPMDTRIYALLKGVSPDGRETAAPAVLWEHDGGDYQGGRWIFINRQPGELLRSARGLELLKQLAGYCAQGVSRLWVKPNYAAYEPGEQAMLTLQAQRLAAYPAPQPQEKWTFTLTLRDAQDRTVWAGEAELADSAQFQLRRLAVPVPIEPGLYTLTCRAESRSGEARQLVQGFWGMDRPLLHEGSPVTAGRDYFIKDGRPLPVVGMTYMTSDVARKFLFLPNASLWDRDMARMRRAGINWIRTGIWTAYRGIMQVDGHASEEVLRAVDAFLLTAKRHGLQVTFTFFSFTPELWEGENPYLDPRSREAQKRFIRSIVSRHRDSTHVDWDLINEPSMFDPKRIFSDGPRSAGDRYEREAFPMWLEERHGTAECWQERWGMTPEQLPGFSEAGVPRPEDINFDIHDMKKGKQGAHWLDYVLFSMEMHNRWAAELRETIKELCPGHLVTVGQDEGLGAKRPSPLFYEQAVDYTTVHTWWLNDHLIWDGVFAKTPAKPNLIQETGIMYLENADGRAKRSENELRALLERKYAYAFATGGAGAIHWIWNTNFYMNNANESHIGALRADGTEKPEAEVSYAFGAFMEKIRDLFEGRKLEDIAVVYPYSNDFSNRSMAFDATTRASRVLSYDLKLPFRAAGEYNVGALEASPPKLLILPSAHNFDDVAFEELLRFVQTCGTTLLVTGPLTLNAYWQRSSRLEEDVQTAEPGNVRREETLWIDKERLPVSFGGSRIAQVLKQGAAGGGPDRLMEFTLGAGRLLWCPLPVELSDRPDTVAKLYAHAAERAGCESGLKWKRGGELPGIYGRRLPYAAGSLYIFVSEMSEDAEIEAADPDSGAEYSFRIPAERAVLFAADLTGRITAVYRPEEQEIRSVLPGGLEDTGR